MRAAVLSGPGRIAVHDVPEPEVPEDWALVRVAYNSICGSDVSLFHNAWHGTAFPAVPGHEWSGHVVSARGGALAEGQPVVGNLALPCGRCPWCRAAQGVMCPDLREFGFTDPGACADYIAVPVANLHPLPEHVDLLAATQVEPLAVALHALARVDLKPGETVAVLGCGGIGLTLLQAASAGGGRVVLAVDPVAERAATARDLGAREALSDPDAVAGWIERAGPAGLPDVVLEASGEPEAVRAALDLVRPGGRVGLVGYRMDKALTAPSALWPLKLLSVIGVMGPGPHFEHAVRLVADGALRTERVVTDVFDLSDADKAFGVATAPGPGVIRVAVRAAG